MPVHLLLVPVLLYSLAVGAADEPQPISERWGDLAPEYGDGECNERLRRSSVDAAWTSSRPDSVRDMEPSPPSLSPTDAVQERSLGR